MTPSAADRVQRSAAPPDERGSQVVVGLHDALSRRNAARSLRIFALGDLRLEAAHASLSGEWLDQRAGQLLRFLICRRGRITPADVIAEAIWPHVGASAPNTVRHFVHALRDRLEPGRPRGAASAFIECRRGGYALCRDSVWIDADAFEQLARDGTAALAAGERSAARRHLEHAAALYRDDFLVDEPYADWAFAEREHLRATAHTVFQALADLHADDPVMAVGCLERLADLDPFDDDVQRQLIAVWLQLGRKSRAARQYDSFRVRVLREFGEPPSFDLSQLVALEHAAR